MKKRYHDSEIRERIKAVRQSNGDIQTVLDYIEELEQSGLYSEANICSLKGTYYSYIDDVPTAYYWAKQSVLFDPTDYWYHLDYAKKAMDMEYFAEALASAEEMLRLAKNSSLARMIKMVCYFYLQDYDSCYEILKTLPSDEHFWLAGKLQRTADIMTVLEGLGYPNLYVDKPSQMKKRYHDSEIRERIKAVTKSNGDIQTVLDYIEELEQSGLYSEANICSLKETYYSYIGDVQTAYYWAKQAALLDPTDYCCHSDYAMRSMDIGYFSEALASAEEMLRLKQDDSIARMIKMVCYFYLQDYDSCYEILKTLPSDECFWLAGKLQKTTDIMAVLEGLGYPNLYVEESSQMKQIDPKIEIIEKVRAVIRSNGDVQTVLDYIEELKQSGLYSEANICSLKDTYYSYIDGISTDYYRAKQVVLLYPTDYCCHSDYAMRSMDIGYFSEALASAEEMLRLKQDDSIARMIKMVCYFYLQDYDSCYEVLKTLPSDERSWLAGKVQRTDDIMAVLESFGYPNLYADESSSLSSVKT